jgi:hypothetical protein
MNGYLATEIAYKNGYKAGVENFSKELIKLFSCDDEKAVLTKDDVERLVKQFTNP